GKSWGCCSGTSCYIPASCQDAGAEYCDGTPGSQCPFSPIMSWCVTLVIMSMTIFIQITLLSSTYGASSRCLQFVMQTASDDDYKITSWGCGETPATFILEPVAAARTGTVASASATESSSESSDSSGLSQGATIAIAVVIPIVVLAIVAALAVFFLRRRRRHKAQGVDGDQMSPERLKPDMQRQMPSERGPHEMENSEWVHELENHELPAELEGQATRGRAGKF
ncbi:hypothetical protein B0T10DRAFT_230541, partial [Thelonectria olida]